MGYILRRFVAFIAGFAGLATYEALRGYPFAIDVALAVGYTVEVAGLVVTAQLVTSRPSRPFRPIQQMLLIHAGFLAGVVVIERIFPLLQLLFPGGPTQHGRQGSWALLIEVIVISVLGLGERWVLRESPKPAAPNTWAEAVIAPPTSHALPVIKPARAPAPSAVAAPIASSNGFAATATFSYASAQPSVAYTPIEGSQPAFAPPPSTSTATTSYYLNSSGDEYEEFLKHLKSGKRPFRKPGMSVRDEYEAWYADRLKNNSEAPQKKAGLGRFLQLGRNQS